MLARHLLSVLLLPFTMVVLVPSWVVGAWRASDTRWPDGTAAWAGHVAGVLVFLVGFALFVACVRLFAAVGRGTLAPWDPTRRLVAVGPYRYVRNPMISGVATMLVGESLVLGSRALAILAAGFVALNHVYFLLSEEPGLASRFGDDYRRYRARVPRWIPRLTPIDAGPLDAREDET